MLAFQVSINGKLAGTFGFKDWAVLTAFLTATSRTARENHERIEFSISGVEEGLRDDASYHVRCFRQSMSRGEDINLKIVDTDLVDPPLKRYRSDAIIQEDALTDEEYLEFEREEYERLKAKFEPGP